MYIDKIHCQIEFVACHDDIINLEKMLQLLKLFFIFFHNLPKYCRPTNDIYCVYKPY